MNDITQSATTKCVRIHPRLFVCSPCGKFSSYSRCQESVWDVVFQFLKPFDLSKPNFLLCFTNAYKTFFLLTLTNFVSSSKKRCLFFLQGWSRGQCDRAFRRDPMGLCKQRTSGFGINVVRSVWKKFARLYYEACDKNRTGRFQTVFSRVCARRRGYPVTSC